MTSRSIDYLPRPASDADLRLMRRIDELHREHFVPIETIRQFHQPFVFRPAPTA